MGNRIVVANWKMNLSRKEGLALTDAIVKGIVGVKNVTTILAVPFPFLAEVGERIANVPNLHLAAQNCSAEENGAFTGEISAQMLKSFGVESIISKILEEPTENDWRALAKLDEKIEELQLHVLRKELSSSLMLRNKFETKVSLLVGLKAIRILDLEYALDWILLNPF